MLLALIDALFILGRKRAFNALTVDEVILKKSVRGSGMK
jgi:hypothetical protein